MLHDVTDISEPWDWSLKIFEHGCQPLLLTIRPYRITTILTFGLERDEVKREWKKIHNEELNDLCCSPNIFRLIKSRK